MNYIKSRDISVPAFNFCCIMFESLRALHTNFVPLRTISLSLRAIHPDFIPLRTISLSLRALHTDFLL